MRIHRFTPFATFALLLGVACNQMNEDHPETTRTSPARAGASIVLTNATLVASADASATENAVIVIENGRITHAGPGPAPAPDGAERLDLQGGYVFPGLVDAHAHLLGLGTALEELDLVGTTSLEEIADLVARTAAEREPGEWIFGRGWDQNDWESPEFPTAALLDKAAPENPVLLSRIDGHATLANSLAIELAEIDVDTPDPEGGMILRDESGRPSGVFIDTAETLFSNAVPEVGTDVIRRRLARATREAARFGLTSVHEAGQDQEYIDTLLDLEEAGELPIRVYVMLTDDADLLDAWFDKGPFETELVTVRAVKLYADGALGSRGAALLADYSDADHDGLLITKEDHILDVSQRALTSGFQVNTHAIGDRGVRTVIDAYEKAGVGPDDRFRIEHLQVASLDDIERIADLGLIASMQPTHATSDMPWAEKRVGPDRIRGAYAWRKLTEAGIPLALGSDFPVERVDPLLGIYSSVSRQDLTGRPPGGWYPEERLTVEEALAGFTTGAHFAAFREEELGRVESGMLGDLVVLDRDPRLVEPHEIPSIEVLHTISAGRVVYSAE